VVKPAQDEKSTIMIPLEKASRRMGKNTAVFFIDLVYLQKYEEMKTRGEIVIEVPSVDIPISQLFVSAFLPVDYKYGAFKGMNEVEYWTQGTPPIGTISGPMNNQLSGGYGELLAAERYQSRSRHIFPVRVEVPRNGVEFKFEHLLVTEQQIEITGAYRRTEKSHLSKRSVSSCSCCLV